MRASVGGKSPRPPLALPPFVIATTAAGQQHGEQQRADHGVSES
jgi:hypothetical protein